MKYNSIPNRDKTNNNNSNKCINMDLSCCVISMVGPQTLKLTVSRGFYRQADHRLEVCLPHTRQTETDLNTVYMCVKKSSASVVHAGVWCDFTHCIISSPSAIYY